MKGTELIAIKKHLVRAAAVGVLGGTAVAGFIAPASAAQIAGPHLTATSAVTVATKPNTNITGSPARWNPTKLTAAPISGTCSRTNYSFTMTNKTAKAQTILYKTGTAPKRLLGTLKRGEKAGICGKGAKGTKATFYIKGAKSVLTVTLS